MRFPRLPRRRALVLLGALLLLLFAALNLVAWWHARAMTTFIDGAGARTPRPEDLSDRTGSSRFWNSGHRILGDGLVPLESALGKHRDPARALGIPDSHRWVGAGVGHLDLLDRPEVYAAIRGYLSK